MGEKDTSQNRAPSVSLMDGKEHPGGDSELAQRIWNRYGTSPGVIPLDSVLQRARYTTQFGASRLPLLADVQRRWSGVGADIRHTWPAMSYIQWSASSLDEDTPSTHAPGSEVQRSPRAQVIPSRGPGIQRDDQPRGTPSGGMFVEDLRKGDRSTGMGQPSNDMTTETGRPEVEGEITTPAAINTDSGGADMVQRHVRRPARRVVQRQAVGSAVQMQVGPVRPRRTTLRHRAEAVASVGQPVQEQSLVPTPTGPAVHQEQERDDDRPKASSLPVHPSAGTDPPIDTDGTSSFATTTTGDVGASILQRHLDGPVERAVQRDVVDSATGRRIAPSVAVSSVGWGTTVLKRRPSSPIVERAVRGQTVAQESRAEAKTRISSEITAGDLGTSALQRHMSSPIERVLQYKAGYQAMEIKRATPATSGQGGRGDPAVPGQLASSEPSSQAEQSTVVTDHVVTTGGRDLGASIVRRYLSGPLALAWRGPLAMPGAQTFFADTGALQSPPLAESGHVASRVQAAPIGVITGIISPEATSLQRRADDGATRLNPNVLGDAYPEVPSIQPVTTLSVLTAQGPGVVSNGVHAGDKFHPQWPEMPLLAGAVDYSSAGTRRKGTPWVQQWLVAPGAPGATLQRTSAGASGETPVAGSPRATLPQDIGGYPSPRLDQSGQEGLDLERLADEVYTIIERRLIVEKENQGL